MNCKFLLFRNISLGFCILLPSLLFGGDMIKTHTKIKIDKIKYGNFKIEIATKYIDDSTSRNESLDLYPLIVQQKILLFKDNIVIRTIYHQVPHIKVNSTSNGQISILENRITNFGIVKGSGDCFFCITGWGGCSSCSEYSAILNKNGQTLFLLYSESSKILKKYGELQNTLKKYKIDGTEYRQQKYLNMAIDFNR